MVVKTVYFIGSDGSEWNGKTYWNKESMTGSAQILSGTESGVLYFDITLDLGNCCLYGDIYYVTVTIGNNTYELYKNTNCVIGSGNVQMSWQIPTSDLSEGQAELSWQVCIGGQLPFTAYGVTITAYISESLSPVSEEADLTVTVSAYSVPVSGLDVIVKDTNTEESYSQPTDQNGIAYFANLEAGDTVDVTASSATFQTVTQSLTLQSGSNAVSINLECPSGFQYCKGQCINACGYGSVMDPNTCECVSPIATSIGSIFTSLAIAGLVIAGGIVAIKLIPTRKETITKEENLPASTNEFPK